MAASDPKRPDLLSAVVEAHGGLERFNKTRGIELVVHATGAVFTLKGYPWARIPTVYVDTKSPKVVFQNFGGKETDPSLRWIWTKDRVWTEKPDGTVVSFRDNPRANFKGHTLLTKWDDFDLLYFSGYAMWNYLTVPFHFTWPGFETRELEPYSEPGEAAEWRVLEVTYPDDYPTHTKTQKFYFDNEYKLRRLDYAAEVVQGGVASHYVYDHRVIDGISIPTHRRVLRGDGALKAGPSMVLLVLCDIKVRDEVQAQKL